jgi:hypothetical protein
VLASRLAVLAAFVAPRSSQPSDSAGGMCPDRQIAMSEKLRDVLMGAHYNALYVSTAGLERLVANYVRLGIFASQAAAHEGCLRRPRLLRCTSWRAMVRRHAAVQAVGGTMDHKLLAEESGYSAQRVTEAGMLRDYTGCAFVQ